MEAQYEVLEFKDFSQETSKLLSIYNASIKRFVSLPLPALIDATLKILNVYKGERITQAKVLTQLALELKNDPNVQQSVLGTANSDYMDNAQQVLLGALIHRYFRLESGYVTTDTIVSTVTGYVFTSLFKKVVYNPKPEDCRLFVAIKQILNISFENKLDSLTIVSACNAFRDYMEKDNKYQSYEHLKDDLNFFNNLDAIIAPHKEKALPLAIESNKLRFLAKLSVYLGYVQKELLDCFVEITKTPLSKGEHLSYAWIEKRLTQLKIKESIKTRVCYLLDNAEVMKSLTSWNLVIFQNKLTEFVQSYSAYALFGAYMVIYHEANPNQTIFCTTLETGLHFNPQGNRLDAATSVLGLEILDSWFMQFEKETPFSNWDLFEDSQLANTLFEKALMRVKTHLQKKCGVEEKKDMSSNALKLDAIKAVAEELHSERKGSLM